MATKEQIEFIAEELPKAQPTNFLKTINDTNAGIGFALKSLYKQEDNCLTAGEISETMCVSTARVAVLLRKMESKGLIVRENDSSDARITKIRLSEEGKRLAKQMRENMLKHISDVIDKLGMEKLLRFIELSVEVKNAMSEDFPPNPDVR